MGFNKSVGGWSHTDSIEQLSRVGRASYANWGLDRADKGEVGASEILFEAFLTCGKISHVALIG